MRSLLTHSLYAGALLTISFLATGCLEESNRFELQPDGSGTMKFEQKLGAQMSMMMNMDPNAAKQGPIKELEKWSGIDAWTDVESTKENGQVVVRATGWFKDLSKVVKTSEQTATHYTLKREGETLEVGMTNEANKDGAEEAAPGGPMGGPGKKKSIFDTPKQQLEMSKGMLRQMLAGFRMEQSFKLPSKATEVSGFKQDEKDETKVAMVMDSEQITKIFDLVFAEADELRPKVESGELSKEDAEAQMQKNLEAKIEKDMGPFSTRCTVESAEPDPAFLEAFEAAKKSWAESKWNKGTAEEAPVPDDDERKM